MIFGIAGLILLAVAWVPETVEIIRNHKDTIDWKFGVLYVLGSLALAIHSYQIGDTIFVILNLFILVMSLISLIYSLKK
jgi:lipid-A-disaccharide synthase-like uncharacterized protein